MRDYTSIDFPFVLYNAHTEEFQYSRYYMYIVFNIESIVNINMLFKAAILFGLFPYIQLYRVFHVIHMVILLSVCQVTV